MMILTPYKKRPVLQPCTLPERNYQVDPYIGCEHYCYYCLFEANTMDTEKRIEALRQMKAARVRTGALICPFIPYITGQFNG
jgi:DNA repair photolyase